MYTLDALQASRAARFHHARVAPSTANQTDAPARKVHPAAKLVIHKAVGGFISGGMGFLDTYSGMPAFGADASGKGGVGVDTIATGVVNIAELGWILWKGAPIGAGTYLEPIASGIGDGLLFGWTTKFGQVTGAAKKGGADAVVAGLDFNEGADDAPAGLPDGRRNARGGYIQQEVVFDPMHGMR